MSTGTSTFSLVTILSIRDMMSGKIGEITSGWDRLRKSIAATTEEARVFDASTKSLKWGVGLSAAGTATGLLAKSFVSASIEVGKLSSNIQSLEVAKEDVEGISSAASIMAARMGTAQDTYLSGIYDIKSAISTLDPGELVDVAVALDKTAKATKGSFVGLSDLIGVTHSQFKRMYTDLTDTQFANLFGNTITIVARLYKTSGEKMQQAMQALGPAAAAINVSLEEQSVILGTLQNQMQPGSAGTSYRQFLAHVGEAFQELGLKATDSQGKLKSMPDLLDELKKKFGENLTVMSKMELKKAFGTQEAVGAIEALLSKSKELRDDIESVKSANATGTWSDLENAAKINMNNLATQLDRVGTGWGALKSTIAGGFSEGPLKIIVKGLADIFEKITIILNESPLLRQFASIILFGGTAVLLLGGAMLTLVGVVGMYAVIKKNAMLIDIYDGTIKLAGAVKTGIATAAEWLHGKAMFWSNTIRKEGIVSTIAYSIAYGVLAVKTGLLTTYTWLKNTAMSAYNAISLVGIKNTLTHSAAHAWSALKIAAHTVATWLHNTAQTALNLIQTKGIMGTMGLGVAHAWSALKIAGHTVAAWALAAATTVKNNIQQYGIAITLAMGAAHAASAVKIGFTTAATWLFNTALFACPITWIILGIVALGVAVVGLVVYWDKVTGAIKAAFSWLKKFFGFKDDADVEGMITSKINKLTEETAKLKEQQARWDAVGMRGEEYAKVTDQILQNEKALKGLNEELTKRQAGNDRVKELQEYVKTVEELRKGTEEGSSQYQALTAQMEYVNQIQAQLKEGLLKGDFNVVDSIMKNSALEDIKKAGQKFSDTFASGIQSSTAIEDAVKNMMEKTIKPYLPHSDAKKGALSELTKSGRSFVSTWAGGIEQEAMSVDVVNKFTTLQAKQISEKSPVIQKISSGNRTEAKNLLGSLTVHVDGKNLTIEKLSAMIAQVLSQELNRIGAV
ncbi:MAG: phage tail tape measure protein [Leptospirales bacterium]|nr:phage tail tape measure protein [Leptospirales bacterium]